MLTATHDIGYSELCERLKGDNFMMIPKPLIAGLVGLIMFESIFPDEKVHTHQEEFPEQNLPGIFYLD